MFGKKWLNFFLIILTLILPFLVKDKYWMHTIILMCIWSIAAISLNLIMGYTGQANLAMGGFFGIGAYATALLMLKVGLGFWEALVLSAFLSSVIGFLIGLPTLRSTGHYFCIATLCFNAIVFIVMERWEALTRGPRGLMGIPLPSPIELPLGLTVDFTSLNSKYYLVLFFLSITLFISHRIVNSLVGRSFIAVRESEELTSSIGINPMKTKVLSLVVSVFLCSISGSLYAVYIGFLDPEISSYEVTFEVLLYVVIGGIGTISGPILGTIVVTLLSETLHYLGSYRLVAYGLVLILVIIFIPHGIVGSMQNLITKIAEKNSQR